MQKALIDPRSNPARICEIRPLPAKDDEAPFPVSTPLEWVDVSDEVTVKWTWLYNIIPTVGIAISGAVYQDAAAELAAAKERKIELIKEEANRGIRIGLLAGEDPLIVVADAIALVNKRAKGEALDAAELASADALEQADVVRKQIRIVAADAIAAVDAATDLATVVAVTVEWPVVATPA